MDWKRGVSGTIKFFGGKGNVTIGESSSTVGKGLNLSSTGRTELLTTYADDGGTALGASSYSVAKSTVLLTAVHSAASIVSAVRGYFKAVSGATVVDGGAFRATVDVPTGATIASGKTVSALRVSGNLGGTHTGKAAILDVPATDAGSWDFFANFASTAAGAIAVKASNLSSLSASHRIAIQLGSSTLYIPVVLTWA